jgi:hypothetical protein
MCHLCGYINTTIIVILIIENKSIHEQQLHNDNEGRMIMPPSPIGIYLHGQWVKNILLIDIIHQQISFGTRTNALHPLIQSDSTIPCKKTLTFNSGSLTLAVSRFTFLVYQCISPSHLIEIEGCAVLDDEKTDI